MRITSGVTLQASKRNQILTNIRVTVPEDFVTRGLLGQFNGDPTDDLLPWNSALPLPTDSATEEIHYHFGTTCKTIIPWNLLIVITLNIQDHHNKGGDLLAQIELCNIYRSL